MSAEAARRRLIEAIRLRMDEVGGEWVDEETIRLEGCDIPLQPLLSVFQNILGSKEYTHLPPLFDSRENFSIADMYVELAVAPSHGMADPLQLSRGLTLSEELDTHRHLQRARRLTIEQAVHNPQHRNIVILGDPGSGKTSLLKHLTLKIAGSHSPRWILPIYISLRSYWRERTRRRSIGQELTLAGYAAERLFNERDGNIGSSQYSQFIPSLRKQRTEMNLYAEEQHALLKLLLELLSGAGKEHVLFLLDGFDELASQEEAIESLTDEIGQLRHGFSWVVTSRHTGFFGELHEDARYEMVSLDKTGIEELVSNWFRQVSDPHAEENRDKILAQIWANPRLLSMAHNPFLLSLLCHIRHKSNSPLPLQRSEVYDEIVSLMRSHLRYRNRDSSLLGKREFDYLCRFSHYLYTDARQAPKQLFDNDDWDACAETDSPPSLHKHFLPSRLLNGWREDGDYHFIHLTFQEYFIARYLAGQSFELVKPHIYKPHWRMVIRFLAGMYWHDGKREQYIQLLRAFTDRPDLAGLLYIEAAWIMAEAGLEDSTPLIGLDLRETLWKIMSEDELGVHRQAGKALAILSPGFMCRKIRQRRLQYSEADDPDCRGIHSLTMAASEEADQLLVDVFLDEDISYPSATVVLAISAIRLKDSQTLRRALLAQSGGTSSIPIVTRICDLAKGTQHSDFVPWLLECVSRMQDGKMEISPDVFDALAEIAAPESEGVLRQYIEHCGIVAVPFKALEAFAAIGSDSVRQWFADHRCQEVEARQRLLVIAIAHNFVDSCSALEELKKSDEDIKSLFIKTVEDATRSGRVVDPCITEFIADIAFSDDNNRYPALKVLTNIAIREARSESESESESEQDRISHLQRFRDCLIDDDPKYCKAALDVLCAAADTLSLPLVIEIADSHAEGWIRVVAIKALVNFRDSDVAACVIALESIIKRDLPDLEYVMIALRSLALIDIRSAKRCSDLLRLERCFNSVACDLDGLLVFNDSYVDKQGEIHYWEENQTTQDIPRLDPHKTGAEQQEALRIVCQYLIDENHASIAGTFKRGKNKLPLFKNDNNRRDPSMNTIDRKTGVRFLSKQKNIHPDKADVLMNWIMKHFRQRLHADNE